MCRNLYNCQVNSIHLGKILYLTIRTTISFQLNDRILFYYNLVNCTKTFYRTYCPAWINILIIKYGCNTIPIERTMADILYEQCINVYNTGVGLHAIQCKNQHPSFLRIPGNIMTVVIDTVIYNLRQNLNWNLISRIIFTFYLRNSI